MRGQRTMRNCAGWLLGLLLLAGCRSPEYYLRPPKPPEELVSTPPNDKRFSNPPVYPADALNSRLAKAAAAKTAATPPARDEHGRPGHAEPLSPRGGKFSTCP